MMMKTIRRVFAYAVLGLFIPIFGHSVLSVLGNSGDFELMLKGLPIYRTAILPSHFFLAVTPWGPFDPSATYHGVHSDLERYVVTMLASGLGWFLVLFGLDAGVRKLWSLRPKTGSPPD